jgi:4-amino-4-deoxy-L-arabinose transferase-like glycosyltransferase
MLADNVGMEISNSRHSIAPDMLPATLNNVDSPALGQIGAVAGEARWKRWLFAMVALAIIAGFAFFMARFFAPAPGRPGIDENAYLLGGRNILEHHTVGWKPANDYLFVGHMWFRTKDQMHPAPAWLPRFARGSLSVHTDAGWYYPKYPAGLPLLNAIALLLGGAKHGPELAFVISPLCMTLSLVGMFLLARSIVGSFYAMLAMIVLATTPTSLEMAEIPNSHAPALCFVVWGMFFLVRWLQSGSWWRGVLAGFLLGYAVTIRYSEALLLFPFYPLQQIFSDSIGSLAHPIQWMIKGVRFLPVGPLGLVALMSIRIKHPGTYFRAALPLIAWAVPVGLLVAYNWFSTGQMTGYDATNESSGFSAATFLSKWDFTVYQLYLFGLFLFLPLGIAGLVILFRGNWRLALVLTMWAIPGSLLYTAYYWGDRVPGVAFLRFFLTVFPPMIIAGLWLLRAAGRGSSETVARPTGSIFSPLAAGILVAATAGVSLANSLADMNRQYRGNLNLHYSETQVRSHISPHDPPPVIFADNGMFPQFLQYAQFMINADWYATDVFEPRVGGGFGIMGMFQADRTDQNAPVLLQQDRIDYIDSVRKGKSDADFIADEHHVMDTALRSGRRIFLVTESDDADYFRRRFINGSYQMKRLDHWKEPYDVNFPSSEQNHLGLAPWSGEPFIHWRPEKLNLYEIGWTPTTQPTTRGH